MTEHESFIAHWEPTYGPEGAEQKWQEKQAWLQQKHGSADFISDTEGYLSPTTGKWIEGRKARRDDLARSGARPWEGLQVEQQEAARQKQYIEQKQDKAIEKAAWQAYYAMSPEKRRKLRQG
jgi:hypothetical protein